MDLVGSSFVPSEGFSSLIGSLVFAGLGIIIGPPLLFGIIRFEKYGCGSKRTILNMLASNICWINLALLLIVRPLDILLFTGGPFSSGLCALKVSLKVFLLCSLVLTFDAVVVVRYLFLFWIINPMALNEKFWHKVITLEIVVLSGIVTTIVTVGSQWNSILFEVCQGAEVKSQEQDLFLLCLTTLIGLSILLHMAIKIQVWIYEVKANFFQATATISGSKIFKTEMKREELFSLAANFICFIILAATIGNAVWIKIIKNEATHHGSASIWFGHLVAPTLVTFTIISSFYAKKVLRNYVVKEMKRVYFLNNPFYRVYN